MGTNDLFNTDVNGIAEGDRNFNLRWDENGEYVKAYLIIKRLRLTMQINTYPIDNYKIVPAGTSMVWAVSESRAGVQNYWGERVDPAHITAYETGAWQAGDNNDYAGFDHPDSSCGPVMDFHYFPLGGILVEADRWVIHYRVANTIVSTGGTLYAEIIYQAFNESGDIHSYLQRQQRQKYGD